MLPGERFCYLPGVMFRVLISMIIYKPWSFCVDDIKNNI